MTKRKLCASRTMLGAFSYRRRQGQFINSLGLRPYQAVTAAARGIFQKKSTIFFAKRRGDVTWGSYFCAYSLEAARDGRHP